MDPKQYPILEFDESREALLEPHKMIRKADVPEHCVITFFREVIDGMGEAGRLKQVASLHSETLDLPVYEADYDGHSVGLTLGTVGAPGAAGQLEELIALGFSKFIVCGGAGVLQKDIAVGNLIVPDSAVRDEGVSYHYAPPSREIECNPEALAAIERELSASQLPYLRAKTWTTDAFYRETRDKVRLRVSEGCVTVEMEAAAFFAVSRFRGVRLGQILYGGDDLSGTDWDGRKWNSRREIRENLVELSMKICLSI